MHYVGRRASETQPLRSIPLFRSVGSVFGATPAELADAELRLAGQALRGETAFYVAACAALGTANRRPVEWSNTGKPGCRAYHQREAMRAISARRKLLWAARRRMVAAAAAHAALTPADDYATPYLAQLAAERAAGQSLAA